MLNPVDCIVHITIHHTDDMHEVSRGQTKLAGNILPSTHARSTTNLCPFHLGSPVVFLETLALTG